MVLWAIVVVVSLEVAALFYQICLERSNPFIRAYREGLPLPVSDLEVGAVAVDYPYPEAIGGWDSRPVLFSADEDLERVLEWGPPHAGIGDQERQERRRAFREFSPGAREVYARLGKEMVVVFGDSRRILKAYGSDKFLFEGLQHWLLRAVLWRTGMLAPISDAVGRVRSSAEEVSFPLYFPKAENPAAILSFYCLPGFADGQEGEKVFVFVDLHPDALSPTGGAPMAEGSRWLRPHFRFRANYEGDAHPGFRTNSLGFRDEERTLPKPPGVFRILCIGGSTTQEGDTNASTYPALLEARLRAAFPGHEIEVVNAGIPGIATPGHLLRFPDYIALEPDLVIMHLGVNDVLLRYNTWLVNAVPSLLRSARICSPSLFAPSLETFMHHHREYMGRNLELLSVMFQQRGVAVAFASMARPDPENIPQAERRFYNYQGHYTWEFPAFSLETYTLYIDASNHMLREQAKSLSAVYIPVAERLHGGSEVFADFCHMTGPAIGVKAQVMFETIRPLIVGRLGVAADAGL